MQILRWFVAASTIAVTGVCNGAFAADWAPQVPQWGIEEIALKSTHAYANPFADVTFGAVFHCAGKTKTVAGFYDGDGVWKVRLMPEQVGACSFQTRSNDTALNGVRGRFTVGAAQASVHGPVHVAKTYHFSYADGTPYFLLGTTSYNWLNRDAALQDRTLASLEASPFNKLRFALFPKWYDFNHVEPAQFPYMRKANGEIDFDRFNPAFFANVEKRVQQMADHGIEADIILFHPYDHWGFAKMDEAHNLAWIRYVESRLGAFRNVWWALANEYDFMPPRDWDTLGKAARAADPYDHPLGIHNAGVWFDPSKPWIDHVIVQDGNPTVGRTVALSRQRYAKPAVIDEFGYEGNNGIMWGDLSGEEEVSRFWSITMAGGYGSHGETYMHPNGVLWWAAGGELVGDSPARLGFLKSVMSSLPFQDMTPSPQLVVGGTALAKPGQAYLFRFTPDPVIKIVNKASIRLSGAKLFKVEAIDPWLMKIYLLGYTGPGDQSFKPPISSGLLRITAVPEGEGKPQLLDDMTAAFAGNLPVGHTADPARFVNSVPHFSADYSISHMIPNPAAKAVLEQYIPEKVLYSVSYMSPDQLASFHFLTADKLKAMDAALGKIAAQ